MFSRIQKSVYKNRRFDDLHTLQLQMNGDSINKERIVMNNALKKYSKFFNDIGINKFPNFCYIMKQAGMKCEQICEFIINLGEKTESEVNTRLCHKSNSDEKNMILTWFAINYKETLISSISLISENKPKTKNSIDLTKSITDLISQIDIPDINNSIMNNEESNQSNNFTILDDTDENTDNLPPETNYDDPNDDLNGFGSFTDEFFLITF